MFSVSSTPRVALNDTLSGAFVWGHYCMRGMHVVFVFDWCGTSSRWQCAKGVVYGNESRCGNMFALRQKRQLGRP